MSKTKQSEQTYAINMTAEQIKLLRGLHLRVLMTWTHNSVAVFLENGEVKRIPLWECWFCGYGSYESSDAIPHGKDCIVTLAEREYAGLNTQFDEVERSIKPPAERNQQFTLRGRGMNYWFWVGVQLVCVIANGVMILYNYANYLKYQKKMFVGLMALAAFWLLWSMVWCVWDVGKATGKW